MEFIQSHFEFLLRHVLSVVFLAFLVEAAGVPFPSLAVPASGVLALAGALSILLGYRARIGAWLLVLFLVPVTLMMHNFWAATDLVTYQIERAMFLKNLTMLGGALLISYYGAGPLSLDALLKRGPVVGQTLDVLPQTASSPILRTKVS